MRGTSARTPAPALCNGGLGRGPRTWRIEGYTIFNSVLLFHSGTNCPLIRVSLVALFLMHGQSKKSAARQYRLVESQGCKGHLLVLDV